MFLGHHPPRSLLHRLRVNVRDIDDTRPVSAAAWAVSPTSPARPESSATRWQRSRTLVDRSSMIGNSRAAAPVEEEHEYHLERGAGVAEMAGWIASELTPSARLRMSRFADSPWCHPPMSSLKPWLRSAISADSKFLSLKCAGDRRRAGPPGRAIEPGIVDGTRAQRGYRRWSSPPGEDDQSEGVVPRKFPD